MTLLTAVLDRVAREVSVDEPTSWLSATDKEYKEIRDDFLLETVDDLLSRVDLPSPIGKQQTITGDGSSSYSLNADFKRLQKPELSVYDTSLDRPCVPISNDGEWTYINDLGTAGVIRYYRLAGYEGARTIEFYAAPSTEIAVSYISNLWLVNAGTYKSAFTDSDDTILFPRRVIETGIVWRWRERKGLPFAAKYSEYQGLIADLSNQTRMRRAINMGERKTDVKWQDLIPAFIPDS